MASMHLNQRLRSLREKCGFTQEQVAKTLNIDRSSYTYYETGKTEPSIASLIKLSNLFKVSIEDLLGSEGVPQPLLKDSKLARRASGKSAENTSHIFDLDKQEKQILCYYRSMDKEKKRYVMTLLEEMVKKE